MLRVEYHIRIHVNDTSRRKETHLDSHFMEHKVFELIISFLTETWARSLIHSAKVVSTELSRYTSASKNGGIILAHRRYELHFVGSRSFYKEAVQRTKKPMAVEIHMSLLEDGLSLAWLGCITLSDL